MDLIKERICEHAEILAQVHNLIPQIEVAGNIITKAIQQGNKIIFCGNGGSAADAQHLAAEIVGRFQKERQALPALALTVDTSALTAISNDYGFENVFKRQLEGLGRKNDVLIGISTSGNSIDVIRAVEYAKQNEIVTIGFTGNGGGKLKELCDVSIDIPSQKTTHTQEMHIMIGHILCEIAELAY